MVNINEVFVQKFTHFKGEKILFLDRDGTLNQDKGYVHKKTDLEILPGVIDFLVRATKLGFGMVLATNQGGAALGKYSIEESLEFNSAIASEFSQNNIILSAAYICFHHPLSSDPKKRDCSCRKPKPGMLTKALLDCRIGSDRALMIGDQETDAQAAASAAIKFQKVGSRELWVMAATQLEEF
ncbi:unannotated protein [freshwater metagenome]|uniref:D,D-heptose 1,7-bisphosphate phosphatase n=1 Tax=freshwater metagenome TaxID=449393 RepID=A0A6J6DZP4_9ZZZZ